MHWISLLRGYYLFRNDHKEHFIVRWYCKAFSFTRPRLVFFSFLKYSERIYNLVSLFTYQYLQTKRFPLHPITTMRFHWRTCWRITRASCVYLSWPHFSYSRLNGRSPVISFRKVSLKTLSIHWLRNLFSATGPNYRLFDIAIRIYTDVCCVCSICFLMDLWFFR